MQSVKIVTVYGTGICGLALGMPPIIVRSRVFRWSWLAQTYAFLNTASLGTYFVWAEVEDIRQNVVQLPVRQVEP